VALLEIEAAQLESLVPEGLLQVGTAFADHLHRGGLGDPQAGMHFAAIHFQVDRYLAQGVRMELQLGFLAASL